MSKKSRFRWCFDKQYGKRAQALFKSASQHLYNIYWSSSSKLSWKKSLLLTCQILAVLVNTLAADGKYPLLDRENLMMPIQMQLSRNQKTFSQFFAAFLKPRLTFEHFQNKDDIHDFCISEITDSKEVVRWMWKKSRFWGPLDRYHCKRAQALLISESQNLYHIHWSLVRKLSWKKSLLFTCQILGLLVNILAVDEKYPVLNRGNLTIPIQMQLSLKQKKFSQSFSAFLKIRINFEHFEKKDDPHSFLISKLRTRKP